jgi:diketogulonate reductase-like aldo/keto reductase
MSGSVPRLRLPSGRTIPALGLGTWRMGVDRTQRRREIAALRLGLDLGMTLIDTAEMYGEGGAEEVVGQAIAGRRDDVFLVSKVYPHNATRAGAVAACERSLKRLKVECLDLYLLHWRERVPLAETLDAFDTLARAGKIRDHGVRNFDVADLDEWTALPGGEGVAANQVLYNLRRRGIEWRLLDGCRRRGVVVMAYSPIDQGRLVRRRALTAVADRHQVTPAQVALAWVLRQPGVVVLPKSADARHVRENRAALDVRLTPDDLRELDAAFPPPSGPMPLEML